METERIINIFVVDDNRMLAEALSQLIMNEYSGREIEVFVFGSGEECLAALDRLRPRIVILDYYLSSDGTDTGNGVEVCRAIKSADAGIFVIFLSGQNKIDIAMEAVREGAHDYVVKDHNAFENISQILRYLIFKIRHEADQKDLRSFD